MSLTILNDWHIGCVRSSGVRPETAYQLRLDLLSQFEEILYTIDTDLMLLGDLFDTWDISKRDLFVTYQVLSDWMTRTGKDLYCVNGNHDKSKSSLNFSSFDLLVSLLAEEGKYAGKVFHMEQGGMTPHGYVIPHVANQELFDMELAKVPPCDFLFLHCNYDNEFAVQSDHSLNLSREQAEALPVKMIVLAHEHVHKVACNGRVYVIGNQTPSSISDCLGNANKHALKILNGSELELIPTWQAKGDFSEQDWRSLVDTGRFIRVTGNATAAEAAQVLTTISRFRQTAKALVITNAVVIEGTNDQVDLAISHEQIQAFNVREALRELLDEDENKKVDGLLRD